jgi:hypothetical protein
VAEEKKQKEKSLEMRVAELEDKLAKVHITEEEMRAYHKVSNLLGGQAAAPAEPLGGAQGYMACAFFKPYPDMPGPIHGCCVGGYVLGACAPCVRGCWGASPGALPMSRPAPYLPFGNLGF